VDVMPRAGPKGTDEIDRLARTLNQVAESRSHEEDYDRTQLEVARKPRVGKDPPEDGACEPDDAREEPDDERDDHRPPAGALIC